MDLGSRLRAIVGQDDEYDMRSNRPISDDEYDSLPMGKTISSGDELPQELSIDSYLRLDKEKKPKKKKSELFDEFDDWDDSPKRKMPKGIKNEKLYRRVTKHMDEDSIAEFEDFIGDPSSYDDEESEELARGLISMGRQYARSTTMEGDSELAKSYSVNEERMKTIYDEITKDLNDLGKDINQMRSMSRGRNFKVLADMNATKVSLHQARIAAVKEMNHMKKDQFDIKQKEKAAKNAEGFGANDISSATFKNLFGAGRDNLLQSIGGYGAVSGAQGGGGSFFSSDDLSDTMDMSDEEIEARFFSADDDVEEEGDKYLKYEHLDPHLEVVVDGSGEPIEVRAADRDGNVLPDYPIPDFDELRFEMNATTGEATDELHRIYKIVQG